MSLYASALFVSLLAAPAGNTQAAEVEWPALRGPNHDGSAGAGSRIAAGPGQLSVRWKARLGSGYSGIVVGGGRAVTMFGDGTSDVLAAFDVATGQEAWRVPVGPQHKGIDGSFDGPVSTPVIAGSRVFAMGGHGELVAVDLPSGRVAWRVDLVRREGAKKPHYGFASSPVVADGVLVAAVGGEKGPAIAGFDPATGARRWTVGADRIYYQSPVVVRVGGRELVAAVTNDRLIGIEPATGRVRFDYAHGGPVDEFAPIGVASAIPVPAGEGRLFLKTHFEQTDMLGLSEGADSAIAVKVLWKSPHLKATYAPPVYHDGYLYGMTGRMLFTCVDAATGELKWRSRDPGDGFFALVGDDIVFLAKERTLHVGPASPQGWTERARAELFADISWTAPVFAHGAVFARSMGELARVDWTPVAATAATRLAVQSPTFARFLDELERAPDRRAAVDAFLAGLPPGPLVDPPDRVVFLYRSDVKDVGIATDLIGIRREDPLHRVPGTDLFFYEARVEPDVRVSYHFVVDYDTRVPDPRNPRRVPWPEAKDGSSLAMPGWREPAYLAGPAPDRRGRMETVVFESALRPGAKAALHVYLPAGYDEGTRRYPSAYMVDGDGARGPGLVPESLDRLMPDRVAPAVVVFPGRFDWGAWKPGMIEAFSAGVELLVKEIVPFVDARFRTIAEADARAVIGQSVSGLSALSAATHPAALFGAVGLQSLFLLESAEAMVRPAVRTAAEQPLRIYHDWGRYDAFSSREGADMRVANRRFNAFLREKGYAPVGGEAPDGAGWASWRNRTDRLFEALLPARR